MFLILSILRLANKLSTIVNNSFEGKENISIRVLSQLDKTNKKAE